MSSRLFCSCSVINPFEHAYQFQHNYSFWSMTTQDPLRLEPLRLILPAFWRLFMSLFTVARETPSIPTTSFCVAFGSVRRMRKIASSLVSMGSTLVSLVSSMSRSLGSMTPFWSIAASFRYRLMRKILPISISSGSRRPYSLVHQAVIKKQIVQLLRCLNLHHPYPYRTLHQVKPLHALLARDIILTLTDQLQSANRRTRLFLCIISECLRL